MFYHMAGLVRRGAAHSDIQPADRLIPEWTPRHHATGLAGRCHAARPGDRTSTCRPGGARVVRSTSIMVLNMMPLLQF